MQQEIYALQETIRNCYKQGKRIALRYSGSSNTTRSKSYNKKSVPLDLSHLTHISIDSQRKIACVGPRVTMDQLVKTTLSYGLLPPVVPEFKGITVGGAIMGCAAESGSHRWGLFSDTCLSYDLICGDGALLHLSATEHSELYYAIPGSYGAFGLLVSTDLQLIEAPTSVRLSVKKVTNPLLFAPHVDFLDGIVFDKNFSIRIEAIFTTEKPTCKQWYFEMAKKEGELILPLYEYLFRYDPGAFWMGAYLLNFSFLSRFILYGLLKFPNTKYFSQKEIEKMHIRPILNSFWRNFMSSQRLWKLHHKAEKWIQNHLVIQDFCLPWSKARGFLDEVMDNPGIFPIWLCPIKNTLDSQLFAPHYLPEPLLNIGLYGLPTVSAPVEHITSTLESRTQTYGGRKVLYSRSYYSIETFWRIYNQEIYQELRAQTKADGVWPDITEKVLSE